MYKRKTKDVYMLIWNGEEIDSADNLKEVKKLQIEYNQAFKSFVKVIKKRVVL